MKFTARLLALGLTVSSAYGMEREDNNSPGIPNAMELMQNKEKDKALEILKKMEVLLASQDMRSLAVSDELKQDCLQLNDQLDAVWRGVRLFNGESCIAYPQSNSFAGVTGNGATVAYNTINNGSASSLTGFVSGTVTGAFARQTGPNQYELTVKVGNQSFKAFTRIPSATATEPIVFNGVSDVYNSFRLNFVGSGAGITDETIFNYTLQSYFRLDASTTAYKFTSVAQDATAIAATTFTINPGSFTAPGLWALSYQEARLGDQGRFKLTNGVTPYYKNIKANTAGNMTAQTVTFNNGFSLILGDAFDGTAAFGNQAIYLVNFK